MFGSILSKVHTITSVCDHLLNQTIQNLTANNRKKPKKKKHTTYTYNQSSTQPNPYRLIFLCFFSGFIAPLRNQSLCSIWFLFPVSA